MIGILLHFFNLRSHRFSIPLPHVRRTVLALVLGMTTACGTTEDAGSEGSTPASLSDRARIEESLQVLNEAAVEGRATGTPGFDLAAEYVANQFSQVGLQPAFFERFLVRYATPIHRIRAGRMLVVDQDSLRLIPGIDFLPHARSDSGRFTASLVPETQRAPSIAKAHMTGSVVSLEDVVASDSLLTALRASGAELVLIRGDLVPGQAEAPIEGLLAVQITPEAMALVRGRVRGEVTGMLRVGVDAAYEPLATGTNVAGYRAGKHPVLARDLVIVCADLDAMGSIAGVATRDMERFGTNVAALLELARLLGGQEGLAAPDRTVLFTALFGGRLQEAGLRAYLRRPLWPLDATRAVIYLGLSREREPHVRALLAGSGIELIAVRPGAARQREGVVLLPDEEGRRSAPVQPGDLRDAFDLSQTIDRIYPEVVRMTEEGRGLLERFAYSARVDSVSVGERAVDR